MAHIRQVPHEESAGLLRRVFDEAVRRAGRVFNILRVQSLNPPALAASIEVYKAVLHGPSPLSRAQREMLAVVVSRTNHCHY